MSDDQGKEEKVKKIENDIKSFGGVIHSENWGLRKLAYPIQKKSTDFIS
ncbi:MAG: 30S ribosomal protein S6 [Crocinitomicaceae bacterium]